MSDNKCHVTNVTVFFDDIYHRILRYISKGETRPKRNKGGGRGCGLWKEGKEGRGG
jgi:hypothetical protein